MKVHVHVDIFCRVAWYDCGLAWFSAAWPTSYKSVWSLWSSSMQQSEDVARYLSPVCQRFSRNDWNRKAFNNTKLWIAVVRLWWWSTSTDWRRLRRLAAPIWRPLDFTRTHIQSMTRSVIMLKQKQEACHLVEPRHSTWKYLHTFCVSLVVILHQTVADLLSLPAAFASYSTAK